MARLGRRFFARPTVAVARDLLGCRLRVGRGADRRVVRIVETEAYVADDPASHAYRGPTPRNRSMFLEAGTLYVYRIHRVVCANLVTRPGEAVLLRAGAPETPGLPNPSGPGRFCRALGIGIADDGIDVTTDARVKVTAARERGAGIEIGPRVGIRRAADRLLRFAIRGDPWVSRPRPEGARRATSVSSSRSRAGARSRRNRTRRTRPSAGGTSAARTGGR